MNFNEKTFWFIIIFCVFVQVLYMKILYVLHSFEFTCEFLWLVYTRKYMRKLLYIVDALMISLSNFSTNKSVRQNSISSLLTKDKKSCWWTVKFASGKKPSYQRSNAKLLRFYAFLLTNSFFFLVLCYFYKAYQLSGFTCEQFFGGTCLCEQSGLNSGYSNALT